MTTLNQLALLPFSPATRPMLVRTLLARLVSILLVLTLAGNLSPLHSCLGQTPDFEAQHIGDWFNLFNGEDLTGWNQKNGKAKFQVVDGTIVGTTVDQSPNSFLCTDRDFEDFELTFSVKVQSGITSAVQIRSKSNQEFKQGRVHGPQIKIMHSPGDSGYVYSEGTGRGWLSGSKQAQPDKPRNVKDAFKNDDWNQFRILAIGNRIRTWVNGTPVADLVDEKSFKKGLIGLQVHGVPAGEGPFESVWKDLKIRELNVPLAHSFIGFGKTNKVAIFSESGEVEWSLPYPASDGWVLANGNILVAVYPCRRYRKGAVLEVNRESQKIVFEFRGKQKEISTVQKIGDQYLIAELGAVPKAILVGADGVVVREMKFDCQKQNTHMQTRMLRMLPNGNYLAPHLLDFAVKEYDPQTGKVVGELATDERGRDKKDWPFTAIRLGNGNTVIGCTNGNRVIEVDSQGKIVWSVTNEDLGEKLIDDACGVQRLPNGNTVISSYHAKDQQVKLLEVTPDKKIVWRFDGVKSEMKSGFHHFQILTTNGRALTSANR